MKVKNILVPIDFSDNALNALEYAFHFAEKTQATIHIFNSFKIDIPITEDVSQNVLRKWDKEEKQKIMDLMLSNVEVLKTKTGADPDMDFHAQRGDAIDRIIKISGEKTCDLIIMGTKGAGDITNRFFGSVTSEVIEKAHLPVMTVPLKAKFRIPKNIAYATEYQYADIESIKSLSTIADSFNSRLTLVHVSKTEDKAEQGLYQDRYRKMIEKHFSYDNVDYKVFHGDDIASSLNRYAEEDHIHMMGMSTKRRSVWEKLYDKSMSRAMSYQTKIPLIVFKTSEFRYKE